MRGVAGRWEFAGGIVGTVVAAAAVEDKDTGYCSRSDSGKAPPWWSGRWPWCAGVVAVCAVLVLAMGGGWKGAGVCRGGCATSGVQASIL